MNDPFVLAQMEDIKVEILKAESIGESRYVDRLSVPFLLTLFMTQLERVVYRPKQLPPSQSWIHPPILCSDDWCQRNPILFDYGVYP